MSLVESIAKNMDTYLSSLNRGASVGVTNVEEPPVTLHTDYCQGSDYLDYAHAQDYNYPRHHQSGEVCYGYAGRGRGFTPRQGFVPRYQQQQQRPQPQFRPRGSFSQGASRFPRQSGPVCEYCYLQVQTRRNPGLDYHHSIKNCEQVGQLQNRSRVGFTSEHTDETHEFAQFVEDFDQVNLPSCQEQD